MGYKIVYGQEENLSPARREGRIRILTTAFFLVFCLLTGALWPEGREALQRVFVPGAPTATEAAFQNLVTDLRLGEPLADALTVFCRRVVGNEVTYTH